ncbi:sensor domain-containing diguanylate cyclase [Paenibacillus silvae]|uniref:sensor domain-containing diguanylate cyclase n=1 Tax=Paenibacillus silvae TaxID=1325358 RepID=UPI0020060A00|nr:sensor domain-containing diguanylate cyclase [Paenibacillus silvae]MCK6073738.1 diguanylate cyclase [Paenibacillus silvae]MCK6148785.1 diguanylate cyclase [Paenibacillus silvae]MCK6267086.1 diguanylate cyclase [Paenibacillus silvae]
MSFKLRTVLTVIFATLSLLVIVTIGSIFSKKSFVAVETEIGHSLEGTAAQAADKLDRFMYARSGEMNLLGDMSSLKDKFNAVDIQILLDQMQNSFPTFSWIGYMDPKGNVLAATDAVLLGKNLSERPVFQEGIKGKFIGDVHNAVLLAKLLPNPSGEPLQFVDISFPLKDSQGKTRGVLAAHLSWAWAKEVEESVLAPLEREQKDLEFFIVSKRENTVLLGPKEWIGKSLVLQGISQARYDKSTWSSEKWPDGKEYVTGLAYSQGYRDYPGLGWTIIIRQVKSTAYAAVIDLMWFNIWTGLAATLLFVLFGWLISRWISAPLGRLTRVANRLGAGERIEIPDNKGIKEIEDLSRSLRNMVSSIMDKDTELVVMQNLAHVDQLTGLKNRTALELYLEDSLEMESEEHTLTFLYLDLDGFKSVNDTLGHQSGDVLLQKVAQRLTALSHEQGITVRLGGDEFLIVLPSVGDHPREEATQYAQDIIQSLNKPFIIDYERVHIGCSIGGAEYPTNSTNPSEIIRMADEALYLSKRAGKNRVTFYSELDQER